MTLIRCMFDGLQMKAIGKQLAREADKYCRNGASIDLDNVCFSYENPKERKPVRKNDKESRPVNKNNKEYRSCNKKQAALQSL